MSSVDYDRYDDRRQRSHRHRDDREPRYVETKETYIRSPIAPIVPEVPYNTRTTEIIRRPTREDSDLSIEEVRRDFPPPTSAGYGAPRYDRYGSSHRSYSADRGYERGSRRSHNDYDDRRGRNSTTYAEEEVIKPRKRSLSRNQKVIAGVAGAALAVGSKELWDRRQAGDHRPIARNPLQSAAAGVAGAFVAYEGAELYAKHGPGAEKAKVKTYVAHKGRDGHVDEYYASDEETVRPKRSKSRRKSIVDQALGLAGIGAGAKALGGRDRDGRSRRGSDGSYDSRGRNRSPEGVAKFQQAAKAALLAGATEAFRVRNEPGGWGGEKGKRILTAAIGAGGVNAAADRNPDEHSKRHILEAVVGGLAGNRLINGSRKDVDVDDDGRSIRSRSRSRSRGGGSGPGQGLGLAALATAGLGALAGKKALDRSRSRSRGGRKSRRSDSFNSRSPSPSYGDRRPKRSKSVTDYARKGLAALGIAGAGAAAGGRDRDRGFEETTGHRSRRGDSDGDYSSRRSRHGNSTRDLGYADSRGDVYGDSRHADSRSSVGGKSRSRRDQPGYNRRVAQGRESATSSDSDLGSSTDDEKKIKKMKGKQLLTAGLASVATIHAAHNVYQSMEKRDARRKAVAEGDMTLEEARKLKAKATLQDVASIGIAALGIKGAFSEIKEANQMRVECRNLRNEKEERHQKRLQRLQRNGDGSPQGSEGISRRRTEPPSSQYDDRSRYDDRRDYGPQYTDGNPYAYSRAGTLPAPPVGYDRR